MSHVSIFKMLALKASNYWIVGKIMTHFFYVFRSYLFI